MNNEEALSLLRGVLARYRAQSYEQLRALVDGPAVHIETTGTSGAAYQIDISAGWDGDPNGDIRVTGNVDDGGWRAFVPLGDSFIKAANGTFVGE